MKWKLAAGVVAVSVVAVAASFTGLEQPTAAAYAPISSVTASGLNTVVADAIDRAVAGAPPECRMRPAVIAGFGEVESHNARDRTIAANGDLYPPIIGLQLNGDGVAKIDDTDGGAWDRDTVYDRAVGPWQFIPSTWAGGAGRDGNGDSVANPHNIYDSTAAAVAKLCYDAGGPIDVAANFERAAWAYNQSVDYRVAVAAAIARFDAATAKFGAPSVRSGGVRAALGDAQLAEPAATMWDLLVVAAKTDGVVLVATSSWRSPEEQAELRWRNGCPDLTSPSSTCTRIATAPVGYSNHEDGLAIDVTNLPGAWEWMAANAHKVGLFARVAGEPWHYSPSGT